MKSLPLLLAIAVVVTGCDDKKETYPSPQRKTHLYVIHGSQRPIKLNTKTGESWIFDGDNWVFIPEIKNPPATNSGVQLIK